MSRSPVRPRRMWPLVGLGVLVCSLAAVVLAGAATKSEPRAATKSEPGAPTTATTRDLGAATAVSPDCPARSAAKAPSGPSTAAVTAQEAKGDAPRVELMRYPRPDTPGNPWSQWGQGVVLADGRYLSALGNHLGKDGNAFLFVHDPATGTLTRFADARSAAGDALDWGYGKIHGQIVAGPCGEAYVATFWGTRNGLQFTSRYRGDLLFRIDPSSWTLESLGAVLPEHGIPSLAGSATQGLVYGEATDPSPATDLGRDQGAFFAYDVRRNEVVFRSDAPEHGGFRNVMVDASGNAYISATGGRLLEYEPGASQLREYPERLPGGGVLRASTPPTLDGTVYGATQNPDRLFALRSDGTIDDLGAAAGYTTSMAVEPDGSRVYYVPGAHGTQPEAGTPVIAVNPRTGDQTTIVRLADLVEERLGLHTAGTYNVVLDAANRRLYVGLNAGATADVPWGEVVLAVVRLPGDIATPAPSPAAGSAGSAAKAKGPAACRSGKVASARVVYEAATDGRPGRLQLTDATDTWGATGALTGMRGHVIATGDVDGDGWTDVFVGTFADRPVADYRQRGADGPAPDRLVLGGPKGFRVDASFPEEYGRTSGAAFGDLDGDGDLDLVVALQVRNIERGRAPTTVFRNDGGRFTRATTLPETAGGRSVGLLDYDADGRLDLFIGEDRFAGGSSVLLRNRGDFAFEDVTQAAGIGPGVAGMGVGTGDLDGDGRPDLFVGGANRLFLNQGDGRFSEARGAVARWTTYGNEDDAAGVAEGDVNGDGRPDLVIGQHYNSTLDNARRVPVRLYLNEVDEAGGLRLRDVTDAAGLVGLPTKSPHVELADVDADGFADIVTTASGADGLPIVFRNLGRTGSTPAFAPSSEPGPAQYWVSAATFDADRDGRLDIVAVEWEPSLSTRFLRNTGQVGHWLAVEAPPGTRIAVAEVGKSGRPLPSATVGTSTGYSAGPSDRAWLGLGGARRVDVTITPPGEKPVELRNVAVDRHLVCGT